MSHQQPAQTTQSPNTAVRKKRRGLIEKRRRDKINNSLSELRRLVPAAFEKQGSAKLEKAEILQMTVDYLKSLHERGLSDVLINTKAIAPIAKHEVQLVLPTPQQPSSQQPPSQPFLEQSPEQPLAQSGQQAHLEINRPDQQVAVAYQQQHAAELQIQQHQHQQQQIAQQQPSYVETAAHPHPTTFMLSHHPHHHSSGLLNLDHHNHHHHQAHQTHHQAAYWFRGQC